MVKYKVLKDDMDDNWKMTKRKQIKQKWRSVPRNNQPVNPHIKNKILRKYNFKCVYCGHIGSQNNHLTIDHVYPKCLGGPNSQSNLLCSCKDCNTKKGKMLLTDFIKKYRIEISWDIADFL